MPKYDTEPARAPVETRGNDVNPAMKGRNPPTAGDINTVRRVAYSGTFFALYWMTEEQRDGKEIRPSDDASIK